MRALIALEDGFVLPARSFTGPGETHGEVIFNTGMTGYQEVLTDPSYAGQMVTMTYPLIGNYGVSPEDVESHRIFVEGFIVKECCKTPSNWRSTMSLPDYLKQHSVMGVEGVDTRALTRHLRLHGAKRGVISTEAASEKELVQRAHNIPHMEGLNLADTVTPQEPYQWTGKDARPAPMESGCYAWPDNGKPRVAVYDYGIKWNILRLLDESGCELLMVPSSFTAGQVERLEPDAVFLSNGPGDPAVLEQAVAAAARLCEQFPVAGICLGHQLLGHALGGSTFKLKFGHHGCNQPVMDVDTGRIEISSQNHGFCVDLSGVDNVRTTHTNLNDGTLEGFAHTERPIIAIQHHPEASPGPHDSRFFFTRFRNMIHAATGK